MKWAARWLTLFATVALAGAQRRPNVLMIMADDLDVALGSEIALPQTQRLLADGGARALNSFVASPRCAPSRTAWLSGRHIHNLHKRPDGGHLGGRADHVRRGRRVPHHASGGV